MAETTLPPQDVMMQTIVFDPDAHYAVELRAPIMLGNRTLRPGEEHFFRGDFAEKNRAALISATKI